MTGGRLGIREASRILFLHSFAHVPPVGYRGLAGPLFGHCSSLELFEGILRENPQEAEQELPARNSSAPREGLANCLLGLERDPGFVDEGSGSGGGDGMRCSICMNTLSARPSTWCR
jgi:hypothetical protein